MKLERARSGDRISKKSNGPSKSNGTSNVPTVATGSWLKPHANFQIRKLIVPIDFSEPSEKAMQYALSIAEEFNSEVLLVHVVQLYPMMPEFPNAAPELNESLMKEAKAQLEKMRARIKSAPCRSFALGGSPAREVVALAEQEQADLIIVGTHGRTGVSHAFLGSVAERIVRLARCPTLVVHANEREFISVAADDAEANFRTKTANTQVKKG